MGVKYETSSWGPPPPRPKSAAAKKFKKIDPKKPSTQTVDVASEGGGQVDMFNYQFTPREKSKRRQYLKASQ